MTSRTDQLTQIVDRFSGQPILVVGDLILDQFVWGRVKRISPEAPVPVVEVTRETVHLGGAANVAANLAALGAQPILVGLLGRDEAGRQLIEELENQGIATDSVVQDENRMTTIKTRILAHQQQVCRTDRESKVPLDGALRERFAKLCTSCFEQVKGVILSDYSKGVLHAPLVQDLVKECRQQEKFVAVDPKLGDFSAYHGASVITPNMDEAGRASGAEIVDEPSLVQAGQHLLATAGLDYLLVTRGEEGMTLFESDSFSHIPTVAREVFDVTGAGDTVVASLTLAVAAGASVRQAAILANHAAGIVIGKLGTAAVTPEEILASLGDEGRGSENAVQ